MIRGFCTGLTIAMALLCGSAMAQSSKAPASTANPAAALDSLVASAKSEGEVLFYSSATENVAKRIAEAFTAKYGIKAAFVRMPSSAMYQRYSAEAESGNIPADLLFGAGDSIGFAEEGIKKGWVQSISQAGLPVIQSGEFPPKMLTGPTAIVQVSPWLIAYNSDKVKGADIPTDWTDLLNPKWKGQILLVDISQSDAFLDFWALLLDQHGDSFVNRLRAQSPRMHKVSVTQLQSLAAGEGAFAIPSIVGSVYALKDKGAPLDVAIPAHTTGVEIQLILTAQGKVKHPNAAKLFANFTMSREGNRVYNSDPGAINIYDTSRLPKQYESPKRATLARRSDLHRIFGSF